MPPGRTPIITKLVNEARRDEVVERIRAQIAQGRQVYWVYPDRRAAEQGPEQRHKPTAT